MSHFKFYSAMYCYWFNTSCIRRIAVTKSNHLSIFKRTWRYNSFTVHLIVPFYIQQATFGEPQPNFLNYTALEPHDMHS